MTQKTQARVYVRYAHPQRTDRPAGSSCDMFSWIALAERPQNSAELQPQDPFDGCCPRCGVAGDYSGQLTERLEGDSPSRYHFPKDINPEDVPAGYPLLVTNRGYQLTS